jgi:hypothetical protein
MSAFLSEADIEAIFCHVSFGPEPGVARASFPSLTVGFRAMTCRLFIDEVGNDDVKSASEHFLSITGITTKIRGHNNIITPEIEQIKTKFFNHGRYAPVVLHRKEILRKEPPFQCLQDPETNIAWEKAISKLIEDLPYIANTVIIDKHEHVNRYQVWHFNPYHYCMRAIIERYVLWLNRHGLTGDVVAEPRFRKVDKALKNSFQYIYRNGTEHIPPKIIQRCLTSHELKFDPKANNVSGLQLVEMIAHPSHQSLKAKFTGEPMKAAFGSRVVEILERKHYARDPKSGRIDGWGKKWLP